MSKGDNLRSRRRLLELIVYGLKKRPAPQKPGGAETEDREDSAVQEKSQDS